MNIAFEISPLITASGSFGDKSGVYRYTWGLLNALIKLSERNHKLKIVLFTFNRDLLCFPINPELIPLLKNPNITLLNKTPIIKSIAFSGDMFDAVPPLKFIIKVINKILNLKHILSSYVNNLHFQTYVKFLTNEFKKNKTTVILHSETGFYPLKGFKNLITIYDLTPMLMPNYHREETNDLQKRKMNFAIRYCDGVVCISNSTKKDLLSHMPYFIKKKIVVCYPGLDTIFRNTKKSSASILKLITLVQKENKSAKLKKGKYLLYYGTFEPRKNLTYLVRAFTELQAEKKIPADFKLIMIGGAGWGGIKHMIQSYLLEHFPLNSLRNVMTLEFLGDEYIIKFIQNAYAVVYPSLYEGFGLPVLESMALGTPVLCSNNSSLPEVGGQDSVLYTDAWSYNDLKSKIKYLINSPKKAAELSRNGLEQSAKFNWNSSAVIFLEFIKTL